MQIIDTITGENVIVSPHGHDAVTLRVRCPQFGSISDVRLTHDQVASLTGALAGIVLQHGADSWLLPEE